MKELLGELTDYKNMWFYYWRSNYNFGVQLNIIRKEIDILLITSKDADCKRESTPNIIIDSRFWKIHRLLSVKPGYFGNMTIFWKSKNRFSIEEIFQ